jgi:hypothetical protein
MDRHVSTEEARQVTQLVVMDFSVAITLVVHLANVDVRDRLTVGHRFLLVFILTQALRSPPSCAEFGAATTA